MLTTIFFLLVGVYLLYKGADYLVDNSAALAKYLGISAMIIGLTVVAFGTSAPELMVGIVSAIKGTTDITFGDIIGANILNITLLVGISALISPIKIQTSTIKRELPILIITTFALFIFALNLRLEWWNGVILMLIFSVFLYYNIRDATRKKLDSKKSDKAVTQMIKHIDRNTLKNGFFICLGLFLLIAGAKILIDSAVAIAEAMHVSQLIIGITIVALGTTLPELTTSIVGSIRKQDDIVVGNLVGSNIFNVLFILGLVMIIREVSVAPKVLHFDIPIMLLAVGILYFFMRGKYTVSRVEGAILVLGYIAYVLSLIL